jgi:hypothetical protein
MSENGSSSFQSRASEHRPSTPAQNQIYSLAGSSKNQPRSYSRASDSYVLHQDEGYNPGHGDGGNQALWGLAKPFPRIVRPKRSSGHATKPSKALYPLRDDQASAPIPDTQLALQISNTSARGTASAQRAQYHHVLVDDPSQEPGWSATKIPFSGMRRHQRLHLRMQ